MPKLKHAGRIVGKVAVTVLKSLLLLPLPIFIMWFNYTSAASAALRTYQFERDSALALLGGSTLSQSDQLNERLVLSQLIQNLEKPFDTIALGSSRILQLSAELVGTNSFYNCGLSGADYRDILNVYYQFEKADKLPKNMIVCLDPWLLNADPTKLHAQSDADLFSEFLNLRLGYQTGYTPPATEEGDWWDLLNLTDFQHNLDYALHHQTEDIPPNILAGDAHEQPFQVKLPDGTAVYPLSYRSASREMVDDWARQEATTFLRMDGYLAPDRDLCLLFHRFFNYVQAQGVNVILMMVPYNPIVYTYAAERPEIYPGFFLTEPWFTRYAQMYDIPLYGSYNPYVAGTHENDYFDGLHIKPEAIPGFFPGVPAVRKAQENGTAKSPWLISGPRVRYEVAERLVVEWNGIAAPEVARRGMDEIIENEVCYLVHRYSDDSENPILLATYAVSRRNGTMYRWATDVNLWVQDPRSIG